MATVKAIEGRSVHQIQSGQVIVDLTSVVKELVENSLDAGATSIDVRFKSQGLEAIEVQDNGRGISKADYENIGLKHYTSKLSNYDDLAKLNTFGFRGEALSSLCALSNLHIVTAQDGEAPKGTRLDFEHSGKLKGSSIAATQKGSLVVVEDLFQSLPVRRRELEKNIKREYSKAVNVLNAYACVSTSVRFSVSQQTGKGKKTVVFSTRNNLTTKENIANVYGTKTVLALMSLDLNLEMQPTAPSQVLKDIHSEDSVNSRRIRVEGHVSKPVHGEGRQTPDRQMFFVNSRPCGLPQVAKAFNEVYKSYNLNQSPFVFANLKMDTNAYDVNVSPDKRTIMLHDQQRLLDTLKETLVDLFESQAQTVPTQQLQASKLPSFKPPCISQEPTLTSTVGVSQSAPQAPPQHQSTGLSCTNQEQSSLSHSSVRSPEASSSALQSSSVWGSDKEAAGLISNFAGRDVEERTKDAVPVENDGPSKDKRKLARRFERDSAARTMSSDRSVSPEPAESVPRRALRTSSGRSVDVIDTVDDMSKATPIQNSVVSVTPRKPAVPTEDALKTPTPQGVMSVGATMSKVASGPSMKSHRTATAEHSYRHVPQSQSSQFSSSLRAFAAPGAQIVDNSNKSKQRLLNFFAPGRNQTEDMEDEQIEFGEGSSVTENEGSETGDDSNVGSQTGPDLQRTGNDSDNEQKHKAEEEARIQRMVQEAEKLGSKSISQKRATTLLKRSRETVHNLLKPYSCSSESIRTQCQRWQEVSDLARNRDRDDKNSSVPSPVSAEERLSLTISKSDFSNMRIVGQFNLGFILAVRDSPHSVGNSAAHSSEELFIIDQHASDEIYNFHRLSATTTLTPQPLVRPHPLQLTAIEEETVIDHMNASLAKNGFNIALDSSGNKPVGERCSLLTLPTSKETIFNIRDLEELLVLLGDAAAPPVHSPPLPDVDTSEHLEGVSSHRSLSVTNASSIIRPTKVKQMLAMRACRSSIMVGKALTQTGMASVVRHMGEIERPWNCPHGRPTMRHLSALDKVGGWNEWSTTWHSADASGDAVAGREASDGVRLPSSSHSYEGREIRDEDSFWRDYIATQVADDDEEDDDEEEQDENVSE